MGKLIQVRMGELKISETPDQLGCTGLGSCIGLVIYDSDKKVGGLAHIILPEAGKNGKHKTKPGKYANIAIPFLIEELEKKGARKDNLWAKMAGGAHMFSFETDNDIGRIGERNAETVQEILKEWKIPVKGLDCGGKSGRTIKFSLETGELLIKTFHKGVKIL